VKTTATMLVIALAASAAAGAVCAYAVDPVKAAWSGKADPEDGVSQTLTCNWDELDSTAGAYVELFVGSRGASPANAYLLDVYEVEDGVEPIASSPERVAAQDHAWLKFPLAVNADYEFTKGKTYEFRLSQRTGTLRCATLTRSGFDTACGGRTMA
jgi:hypothetical protein